MKEEAAVGAEDDDVSPGSLTARDVLQEGLQEIIRELRRSLEFFSSQDNLEVERLLLSGGTAKLEGLPAFMETCLEIPVQVGIPEVVLPEGQTFDPAFAVAIGLALREVVA